MAFGMKHWIGLTTLGLLLVGIWKLPPSALEPRDREFVLPEVTRAAALDDDVQRTFGLLTHMRWSDSLSALTVETAVDGLAMAFPENTDEADREILRDRGGVVELPEDKKAVLRQRVSDELASLLPRADVEFGYYFQLAEHGTPEGRASFARDNNTYLGVRNGQAYCIRVYAGSWLTERDLDNPVTPFTDQKTNATGACRLYLKYGMPGEHVGAWMKDGATNFALMPSMPTDPDDLEYPPVRRSFFGLNFFWTRSVQVDRCMAGIAEGCVSTVTDVTLFGPHSELMQYIMDRSSLLDPGSRSYLRPFGSMDGYLLGDLEAEFGPERFQRFWSSQQELPEAFEAAFGMGLGEWVVTWVGGYIGISPPGPKLSKSAALGGMLALSIFAALAGAWARRRRLN